MSEILSMIDPNNYGLQSMVAGGGAEPEDLTIELGAQDTALSTQQTKIDELESALDNKIALDLQAATSDANATANDIAKDKTAYVNGVKLTGTAEPPVPDWSEIGYSDVPQALLDNFAYSKQIYDDWDSSQTDLTSKFLTDKKLLFMPLVDTSNITNMYEMFRESSLIEIPQLDTHNVTNMQLLFAGTSIYTIPLIDTSNATNMSQMFNGCVNLKNVPALDTRKANNINNMFGGCKNLTTVPQYNWSSIRYAYQLSNIFNFCPSLSNESLNNILASCISATLFSGEKTLQSLGLSSAQATTCQTLSNWDAFVAARLVYRILK